MTAAHVTPDPTMEAINAAVVRAHRGDVERARGNLLAIWHDIGVAGDALHRCTLAHHLADLVDHPAESLMWDVRALDAAHALSNERLQQHHADLEVAGFYPSLYLNLADDLRRLSAFSAAADQLAEASRHLAALSEGPYGDTIRIALDEVNRMVAEGDTSRRDSAPGPRSAGRSRSPGRRA
ncbi:hypothetical protein SAMN05216184_101298 [Georgenia satyanarayanai]|uniref:Tetratricopeptide repeat-containing protein n=1 Tax=Georgenia satyanarayanai TaxID=860221 RepID=A0A2Y8ZYH1_9MICO|nr:hypothetical protein [Georgenia satyanarayanai]PYG01833.1 hypothetical protein A8987_101298 [Georgenia satyanarayanai]SSA36636.1 hypothetical protein SAMN05216184_101298 [Georgenia satyanarayanai]